MVNKIRKGKRIERELEKILQNNGFLTWKPTWNKYGSKDIFNIGDIIAMKSDVFNRLYIIQVKSNIKDFYPARKKLKEFIQKNNLYFIEVAFIVALRLEKNKWRVHIFHNKEEQDIVISNEEWTTFLTMEKVLNFTENIFLYGATINSEEKIPHSNTRI